MIVSTGRVVVDTTKVQFFKQITTEATKQYLIDELLLTPQRYNFSSKSQLDTYDDDVDNVVVDTTKVQFFKQITTSIGRRLYNILLLLTPQRYNFSSKSQHNSLLTRLNFSYYFLADTTIKLSVFKQI